MTTTTATKIKLSQLIQLVLVLSDTKKGEAADLMQVSQPTFSNWITDPIFSKNPINMQYEMLYEINTFAWKMF